MTVTMTSICRLYCVLSSPRSSCGVVAIVMVISLSAGSGHWWWCQVSWAGHLEIPPTQMPQLCANVELIPSQFLYLIIATLHVQSKIQEYSGLVVFKILSSLINIITRIMLLLFSTLLPTVPSEENELISILLSESPVLLNTLEMIRIGYFLLPAKSSIRNYLNLNKQISLCFILLTAQT